MMKNKPLYRVLAVLLLHAVLVLSVTALVAADAPPARKDQPVSTAALVSAADMGPLQGPLDVTTLTTDFEISEGFSTGYCDQNGWTALATSATQGRISNTLPNVGAQHLSIADDLAARIGDVIGCRSPDIGAQPVGPAWMEVDVDIVATAGSFDIVLQAPSQTFITARMSFDSAAQTIRVMDDTGGGTAFVDTGFTFPRYLYETIRIEVDPGANTISYYYGDDLIYTGTVFAGTTIEQIVLTHNNVKAGGPVGHFDNLRVFSGTYPNSWSQSLPFILRGAHFLYQQWHVRFGFLSQG